MKKPLLFAKELVKEVLSPGGIAVDATCGNGYDTLFLAELVGAQGTVFAFDIQPEAISATQKKLEAAHLSERVKLLQTSHAHESFWPPAPVQAVMFNLGYLPGGNHEVITKPESTVAALQIATTRLQPGGIITLVVYTGHAGGQEEYEAVRNFCSKLPQKEYAVLEYKFINQINHPPLLIAVKRLKNSLALQES
ncbi:MAG: methyltransferase domain-containing protein [Firmicutes bacterium]|nr:methyltransferase domain-containing protein [Bacillota bacterium]